MSANRVLTEDELTEQIRIASKKEILAVLKDGSPLGEKFKAAHDCWKQANTELQLRQAERNNKTRLLQMLSQKDRESIIKKNKLYLPEA